MLNQDKVSRLSDVGDTDQAGKNAKSEHKPGYAERWNKIRPTKTVVFGIAVAAIVLTMFVGFNWGGWVTGGTALQMSTDAVTQRLAVICVGQFNQDPQKSQGLAEIQDTSPYRRDDYVKEHGWATMPGETTPDNSVADGCAKLIVQNGQ